ncbi:MAG: hypothetical protein BRD50_07615 [Bacteroidetes bacterium SW_11_45_7]|nr:MAG: hypothetical protein BRD50_07615 [Bacteroidetes bacterium SW_11_45_7]
MNRRTVLQRIATTISTGWLSLAFAGSTSISQVLYTEYVAGYQYAPVMKHEHKITKGDPLRLVREPENPYDNRAIAIYWRHVRVGYIRMVDNRVLTSMMDQQMPLLARVKEIDLQAPTWERLTVEVGV